MYSHWSVIVVGLALTHLGAIGSVLGGPIEGVRQFESEASTTFVREIRTEASGTIVKIYFQPGDFVREGERLAELDSDTQKFQMDLTRAQMEAEGAGQVAHGHLQQRQADLSHFQELFRKRQVNKYQVESAAGWVEWAKGQVEASTDQQTSFAIQNTFWTEQYRKRLIVSSCDGVISEMKVQLGQSIGIAAIAFTITNPKVACVSVVVPTSFVDSLAKNDFVTVLRAKSKFTQQARISEILPTPSADGSKRVLKLLIPSSELDTGSGPPTYSVYLKDELESVVPLSTPTPPRPSILE